MEEGERGRGYAQRDRLQPPRLGLAQVVLQGLVRAIERPVLQPKRICLRLQQRQLHVPGRGIIGIPGITMQTNCFVLFVTLAPPAWRDRRPALWVQAGSMCQGWYCP